MEESRFYGDLGMWPHSLATHQKWAWELWRRNFAEGPILSSVKHFLYGTVLKNSLASESLGHTVLYKTTSKDLVQGFQMFSLGGFVVLNEPAISSVIIFPPFFPTTLYFPPNLKIIIFKNGYRVISASTMPAGQKVYVQ